MNRSASHITRAEYLAYGLILLALLGQRFWHMGPWIDDPHSWRQCDTAFYIQYFFQEGIDLFHPGVCWMGNHPTVILEFPLPEAVAALAYKLLGPQLVWARWVFLLFYLGSAAYLFLLVRLLYDRRLAWDSLVVYMGLPLALFYSRALTVDFPALMFGLGGLYHLIMGYKKRNWRHLLFSPLLFTLAFLIKAPTVFYFAIPLLYYFLRKSRFRKVWMYIPLYLLPLIFFWLWRQHAEAVNLAMPDWDFIPGYLKIAHMDEWYFGSWEMRLDGYRWGVLYQRLLGELAGKFGLLLMLTGMFLPRTPGGKPTWFLLFWLLGLMVYLLIFFSLNVIHNYYQIPFLPLVAIFIALAIGWIRKLIPFPKIALWLAMAHLLGVSAENVWFAENGKYYRVNQLYVEAGQYIQEVVPEGDLLVVTDPFQDPRNPLLLYRAKRMGWAVDLDVLTPEVAQRLSREGALHLAVLHPQALPAELDSFLLSLPADTFAIQAPGRTEWTLEIYRFRGKGR